MKANNDRGSVLKGIQERLCAMRRQTCESSLEKFCKTYLPHHFKLPPSSMHRELFAMLEQATITRGERLAIAAPRGHAKSTIVSLAYLLWLICYRSEPYMLLICHTIDQASDLLSHIKTELTGNERLRLDFPEVCEPLGNPGGPGAPRWRKEEIITRNEVKLTALGAGKGIRGRKFNQHRPTLIVVDDMENEEEARSADQRALRLDWFNKTVLKCGTSHTNVVVVGTILNYDSLLSRLIDPAKSPGWKGRKYQAVTSWSTATEVWEQWEGIYCRSQEWEGSSGPAAANDFYTAHEQEMLQGTSVLWPAQESYLYLMQLRMDPGRSSFNSEKMNDPINPADCYFPEDDFQYWSDHFGSVQELLASLGSNVEILGACDPSMGKLGKHNDDSAIITIARNTKTGVMDVIDADISRRMPDRIIDDIIEYQRVRHYSRFGMEVNQYQEFLAQELRNRSARASVYVPVYDIRNASDKEGRIQRLQPLIKSGHLRFHRKQRRLLEQLYHFPHAGHDDGPDALAMAVSLTDARPPELVRAPRCRWNPG